jgi:DNA repair exonuclease SbcCD ATPase subunit
MKVNPEKLEQEADELLKQMIEQNADPAPEVTEEVAESPEEEDTPQAEEFEENPPEESAETGEDGEEAPEEEDRGDPNPDDSDTAKKLHVAEERVKNAQARMTKATQEAAELRRNMAELQATVQNLQSQLAEAAHNRDGIDDELKVLAEEYPDIAAPLLKKLSSLEETVSEYRSRIDTEKSQNTLQAHFDTIRKSHPDMDEVVSSDDFGGWLERQTAVWQRVAQDGSADEVVELLNRYKETFDTPPQQQVSKVERARRVAEPSLPKARKPDPNSGKRIWTREEITRMPLDEFEKRQNEIDQAYLDGRVR